MNENRALPDSNTRDKEFDDLLRLSRAVPPLPGVFQAEVWRRIEAKDADSLAERLTQWIEWALALLVRPIAASAAMMVMISAGLWIGTQGQQPVQDTKIAYVKSVSPFLQAHQKAHR